MIRIEVKTRGANDFYEEIRIDDEMPVELMIQQALEECGISEDEYRLIPLRVSDD